ncbi:DUF3789 domain-containing protein [Bacillus smithii]|uniref:DUF3789 domain-containing protein n=1 Tax=Bacillus smithii TaxID=1479 RepID=UPI0012F8C025|nr:DUF3789 domain-containing protein [Bacillus smithii]
MKINGGMDVLISFFGGMLIGFLLGGMTGVTIMALMFAAKSADEHLAIQDNNSFDENNV